MSLFETLRIALVALRANKMRSFLTMLGVIIGVASVIVMVSISAGAQKRIEEFIDSLGTNLLIVSPGSGGFGGRSGGAGTALSFSEGDFEAISALPEVIAASGSLTTTGQIISGNINWATSIEGVHADYVYARDWVIEEGRPFTADEIRSGAKVALLGNTVAGELFGGSNPIGQRVRIDRVPFIVIGTLREKGQSSFGRDQDDLILVPITAARNRLVGRDETVPDQVGRIYVKVASAGALGRVEADITDILRQRRHINPGTEDDFSVRNLAEFIRARTETQKTMGLLLAATGAIALVVGGIGIMNIMLVSVTERTREIGLRMAIGARRRDILMQFLGEAVTLCLLGGLIGIVIGLIASVIMARMGDWPTLISAQTVVLAIGAAAFVGIFFGYYPARKAALLNPIDALRYE